MSSSYQFMVALIIWLDLRIQQDNSTNSLWVINKIKTNIPVTTLKYLHLFKCVWLNKK